MGAELDRVEPGRFEPGATLTIFGTDVAGTDMEVVLGDVMLTVVERLIDRLVVTAEGSPGTPIASGGALSAGEMPLVARPRLSPPRTRSSNLPSANPPPVATGVTLLPGDL